MEKQDDIVPGPLAPPKEGFSNRQQGTVMQRLSTILDGINDTYFAVDRNWRFVALNRHAADFFGRDREQLIDKIIWEVFPEVEGDPFYDQYHRAMLEGMVIHFEAETRLHPGRWLEAHVYPSEDGLMIDLRDITARKQAEAALRRAHDELELRVAARTAELAAANLSLQREIAERNNLKEQLIQAQKMEAIGLLAGGVAHDFNNLLTAIIGYCQVLLMRLSPDDPLRHMVEEVDKAGHRAAALTSQLLAFSRKQIMHPRRLHLNILISDLSRMLKRLIGEDVEVITALRPDLGWVKADPGQIEQVLMNLVINARDAMLNGGKLTIETANVELDEAYGLHHFAVQPGPYIMLAVSDTGVGMSRETLSRIFEPFYTTKEKGKGTGLGLSTVFGIVKQSGGDIWVYSEPERGTTFKIYLPRLTDPETQTEAAFTPPQLARGQETILLVEDEESVREMTRKILEMSGYTVLEARDAEDALKIAQHEPRDIHLLLTDVIMPQLSGRSLANAISMVRSHLKVLYVSGYTDDAIVHHGVLDADVAFLQKPFTPEALTRKVRATLDAGA
jgi:two-component system, cell cycle sensor histidine kinase and response regulator CckA